MKLLALAALLLTGCAHTSIDVPGWGRYYSDRDTTIQDLEITVVVAPDGTRTITGHLIGSGTASTVEANRWATVVEIANVLRSLAPRSAMRDGLGIAVVWMLLLTAGGFMVATAVSNTQQPSTDTTPPPAPPEATQVFVWFIPSDCNAPCGTHWVYLLWRDGGLWRRLCDADGCGAWTALP